MLLRIAHQRIHTAHRTLHARFISTLLKDRVINGCFVIKDRVIKGHFMTKDRVIKGRFMTKDRVIMGFL